MIFVYIIFCSFDDVSDFGLIVFIFVIIENIVGLFDYFGSLRANFDTILQLRFRGMLKQFYHTAACTIFNSDDLRTWKSVCLKCNSACTYS